MSLYTHTRSFVIKTIFLDLGWTLTYPASGDWQLTSMCYEHLASACGKAITNDRIEAARALMLKFLSTNHLVATEDEEYAQFRIAYQLLADALPELGLSAAAVEEIAYEKVFDTDYQVFYSDVKPALEALKTRCKLGLISDTYPSAARILKRAGIYDLFDSITFSCFLGVFKPNRKMYEHAIRQIGLPPSEAFFVDDFPANLDGAPEAGITPVMIARSNNPAAKQRVCELSQAGNPGRYKIISGLGELEALIEN